MTVSGLDKVVLITGAAGGLGSQLATEFASQGADLVLLDKDSAGLEKLSDHLVEQNFARPVMCPANLAELAPDSCDQLVDMLKTECAGLDHLVHCAAEFEGLRPLDQIEPSAWLHSLQVNLNSAWLLTIKLLPLLRDSTAGSITFMLDANDENGGAFQGAYRVSKAALRGLAHIFVEELENTSVRVHAIDPGPMRTGLRSRFYHSEDPSLQPSPGIAARAIVQKVMPFTD